MIYYMGDRNTLNQDQMCSLWMIFFIPLIIRWASLGNPGEVNVCFLARDLVNNHWSPPSPPTCSCCCAWFVADCCCREGWSGWGDKEEFWVAFIVPEIEEIISVYWPCNGRSLITQRGSIGFRWAAILDQEEREGWSPPGNFYPFFKCKDMD